MTAAQHEPQHEHERERPSRTVTLLTLGRLDHRWMTRGTCTDRLDLPWTHDAHYVDDHVRAVMARVCEGCPVRQQCRDYAANSHAAAGFWAGTMHGEPGTRDPLDLLELLDDLAELDEPPVRRTSHAHRTARAS